ncbi:MAG: DUF6629 family protein [Bacteriovoracia bacterium]
MCFSPTASFTASALLIAIGSATVSEVRSKDQLVFASTPLLFGAQQLSEGILWLCLPEAERVMCSDISKYAFVSIAQVLWPVWVPLSVFMFEKDKVQKRLLSVILSLGVVMASVLLYLTLTSHVEARILSGHIQYNFMYPEFINTFSLLYLIPTVASYFLSTNSLVRFFGIIILGFFILTKMFYYQFVFSTWCFFSALASMYIYLVVVTVNREGIDFKRRQLSFLRSLKL